MMCARHHRERDCLPSCATTHSTRRRDGSVVNEVHGEVTGDLVQTSGDINTNLDF